MDLIFAIPMGLAFAIVPSLLLSVLGGFSQKIFLAYFCVFSTIVTTVGILPNWFFGVVIFLLATLFYMMFTGRGGKEE